MNKRIIEFLLVIASVLLFPWGVIRAAERGDPVVRAWTTYFMLGLSIAAGNNIFVRSKKLAVIVCVFCVFFVLLATSAAWLEIQAGSPHAPLAGIRGISFFTLLGLASWIHIRSCRSIKVGQRGVSAAAPYRSSR